MNSSDGRTFEQEALRHVGDVEFQIASERSRNVLPLGDESHNKEVADAIDKARKLVEDVGFMRRLCPSLSVISEDAKEVTKLLLAAMLPVGVVAPLSLTPLLVAALAVVMVRIGIKNVCPELK